jgi:26S proteasome regulatory subunit T4
MELLNQMDGFDSLGKVKIIMATNRPDTLDPALLRPGRLDRKIEIGLPNEQSRLEVKWTDFFLDTPGVPKFF